MGALFERLALEPRLRQSNHLPLPFLYAAHENTRTPSYMTGSTSIFLRYLILSGRSSRQSLQPFQGKLWA